MKQFITFLKGILLGFVGLAIPGLSASTIALEVNVYHPMIDAISNLFNKFRRSALFLIFLMLGYFTGGFLGSYLIDTIYSIYPLVIITAILGFIFGGMPKMACDLKPGLKKISCWITIVSVLLLLLSFSFFVIKTEQVSFDNMNVFDLIILFFIGVFTSSTLVIPGVDFAVLLLSLGYYNALIGLIAHIFDFSNILHNLIVLGTYLVGYGIGAFLLSKLIKMLVKKYNNECNFASFAFFLVAPFVVIKKCVIDNPNFSYSNGQLIVGIILGVICFVLMFVLTRRIEKKEIVVEQNV